MALEGLSKDTLETEEAKARQALDLAHRAERLLADDLFANAVAKVREEAIKQMVESPIDDDKARLAARLKIQCLEDVVNEMVDHVRAGQVAQSDLAGWIEPQLKAQT